MLVVPDEGDIRHSELKLGDSFIIVAQRKPGIGKAPFMNYTYLGGEDALDAYLATIKGKGEHLLPEHYCLHTANDFVAFASVCAVSLAFSISMPLLL